MVVQNTSTVLVGRYTRSSVPNDQLYSVNHLLLVIECSKFIMSAALEFYSTKGQLWQSLQVHVLERPLDALKILVPALLYLVQNTLLYVALSNLTAPIFQVTYQGKLVTTALVSVVMLQRRYSVQQWVCLVALSLGVATVVLDKPDATKKDTDNVNTQNIAVGLVAVSIACFSSALAGVYFEKVLKKPSSSTDHKAPPPASLWMRNMQLAFFSVLIAYGQGVYHSLTEASPDEASKPYFHGFTTWAWILVGLQAGGGLLVAAVIKYADNVLKGLATGVSVVVATALSTILFGTPLSGQFSLGALMILASVYLFSNPLPSRFLPQCLKGAKEKEHEMNTLLPK